jgi:hypothetical protein
MYQVEQFTICDGWVNTWHEDGKPLLFDSWPDAVYALAEFYSDMSEAYDNDFTTELVSRKDYRIVEVKK